MKKFILNDVLIVHDVIGTICLRMRFMADDGAEFTYQQPFQLGESIMNTEIGLREMQKGIFECANRRS